YAPAITDYEPLSLHDALPICYKEQRELEALPGQIEALEEELAALQQETAEPSFYQRPVEETRAALARLESLQHEPDALLERWAEVEDRPGALNGDRVPEHRRQRTCVLLTARTGPPPATARRAGTAPRLDATATSAMQQPPAQSQRASALPGGSGSAPGDRGLSGSAGGDPGVCLGAHPGAGIQQAGGPG